MSAPAAVVTAILADVQSNFTTFPVVWPNQSFEPNADVSTGDFAGYTAGSKHAISQVQFLSSEWETHGPTTGGRSREGELSFYSRTPTGTGPKDALAMVALFEGRYRALSSLLSGEIYFGEPLSDELGEIDGWYVWRTRIPFYQITTAP